MKVVLFLLLQVFFAVSFFIHYMFEYLFQSYWAGFIGIELFIIWLVLVYEEKRS